MAFITSGSDWKEGALAKTIQLLKILKTIIQFLCISEEKKEGKKTLQAQNYSPISLNF